MIVPLYVPGEWFAVVTDGSIAMLPPTTELALVAEIWASLRDGARLTDQLQMLLRGGIAALPPFALVSVEGGQVQAIVRGEVEVEVETAAGRRTLSAAAVSTWVEEIAADAMTVMVRTTGPAGASTESSLPVLAAVVRAAGVRVELRPAAPDVIAAPDLVTAVPALVVVPSDAEPEPEPLADPAPVDEPVRTPSSRSTPEPTPEPEPEPIRKPEPASEPVPADLGDLEYALLQPTAVSLAARYGQSTGTPTVPASSGGGSQDLHVALAEPVAPAEPVVPGGVVRVGFAPTDAPVTPVPGAPTTEAAPVAPAPGAPTPEAVDHDGMTVLSSDVVALRLQLPAWVGDAMPGPLAVPAPRTPAPAKLLLSSGLVVSLNRPVLLGRAPQVSRVANSAIPRLVTVASPNQDISRTHAEARMDGEDVLVTDLRSTNGVLLLRQGSGPQRLHPGQPTAVEPGVVVDLGEGVTFTVERGE